jgi:hypothetical protein
MLSLVAGLAAWASAQGPAPGRTAAEQLRLFTGNRALLEALVDRGLKLSGGPKPADRVDVCRAAVADVGAAVRRAAGDPDPNPDRVAELTEHLLRLVADGLTPALAAAFAGVPEQSDGYKALAKLREDSRREVTKVLDALPADGPLGRSAAVRATRAGLAAAADDLAPMAAGDGRR